ncbi:hypothetical protein AVEN_55283-1 [Araneus ventricosus]|uniref:Uncharacterized protein n=1 Tax=Araneus ventricosus TaxID=182803 RepID=A0A4Y2DA65_ARAVE|nr:hypothetical protein AVEN_55283-1 [Araneus ventricosus]
MTSIWKFLEAKVCNFLDDETRVPGWSQNQLNFHFTSTYGYFGLYDGCEHPSGLDDIRSDSEDGDTLPEQDESSSDFSVDEGPQPFSQSELNDLVRDLGLFKDGVELLGSGLKYKNLLKPGTSFSWYRHREKEFTQFLSEE